MSGVGSITVTGVAGTGGVGSVEIRNGQVIPLNPNIKGSGEVGTVSIIGNAAVSVTGISGSGEVTPVIVWGRIIPDPGTVWTEIAA